MELRYVSPCQEDPTLFDGIEGEKMILAWGKQPKQEDPEIQRLQQAVAWCSYCTVLPECTALREASKAEPEGPDSNRIDGIVAGELIELEVSPLGISTQKFLINGKTKYVQRGKPVNGAEKLRQWDHQLDENGCLNWVGTPGSSGRPINITMAGKRVNIRRYLWEQAYGPIPGVSQVLVSCDNPNCGALDHLKLRERA